MSGGPTNRAGAVEPIAIVGYGCRFPGGADDPRAFWRLLRTGGDAIGEVPAERWNADSFYSPEPGRPGTAVTRWGGFVRQAVADFDARFFGMSPREAAHLDPMQRWLLEVTWEALEDAGIPLPSLAGSATGVFVGVFTEDTKLFQLGDGNRYLIGPHTGTGTAMTMAANRLSYWFDLRGPSVSLDTACSSSLIAVHLACQSLWTGESELALAGGANAMFRPEFTIAESKAGMLSPDGRCKTFDASANGYVRGEGAGVVVLKPLAAARRDGDRVHALILGTASNQDGRTQGITVPSGEAQQALMREAFRRAGVSPGRVRYMEAHGTGTPVGDPIEALALAAVLGDGRPADDRCLVGSVKTNIGHLEAAAGVAGLIKATLCLEHREIPPHLHLERPNPAIPFDELCLRVPRQVEAWPEEEGPALAAVNSFGFGGANAHAVLAAAGAEDEAVAEGAATDAEAGPARAELVPLSARSPEALDALAAAWIERLGGDADDAGAAPVESSLSDLAWTAGVRRTHHDHRLTVAAAGRDELRETLAAFRRGEEAPGLRRGVAVPGARRRLAWVFSGMGPQWWAMGRQLLAEEPVFRQAVERCDALLAVHTGESILAAMLADEAGSRMAETRISQPANFALQVGLATLLRSWGVEPDAIVGHSTGEAAAFWAAGVVSLEEAVRIIHFRSSLQHRTTGQGRLAAVELPLEEARAAIAGTPELSIAAVNSPASVTLSGDGAALEAVLAPLQARGVFCRTLRVDVPFHSHFMDPLRGELVAGLAGLELAPARVPLYSTVTGERAEGPELDGEYWWRNVREPVYFAAAVGRLLDDGFDTFLEIGPHPVLTASIDECVQRRGAEAAVIPTLRRKSDERRAVLDAAGALHALGRDLDFAALHPRRRRLVDLPLYPWQRERHWDESAESVRDRLEAPAHPLLGRRRVAARPQWQAVADRAAPAYLEDHRIQGAVLFPGAGFVELGVAAVRDTLGDDRALELEEIRFDRALFLAAGEPRVVETCFDPEELRFEVSSRPLAGDAWTRHARGRLLRARRAAGAAGAEDLDALRARLGRELPREACYADMASRGFQYGPRFQGLRQVWAVPGEALARIEVPAAAGAADGYHVHPAYLDAAFQSLLLATLVGDEERTTYLPVALGRLTVRGRCGGSGWAHSRLVRRAGRVLEGDIRVFDDAGAVQLEIRGARIESLEDKAAEEPLERMFLDLAWQPLEERPEPAEAPPAAAEGDPGTWLLLADRGGVGRALAARLAARGERWVAVEPGGEYRSGDAESAWSLDPGDPEHLRRLLADVAAAGLPPCRGIAHLWSLDAPATAGLDADALMAAQTAGPVALLHLLQALDGAGWRPKPRLWVVTRGAQRTADGDAAVAVAQAPVWGFARTVFHQENVELAGGAIDLDPAAPASGAAAEAEADRLFGCLWHPAGEDQLALRGEDVLVPRLVPAPQLAEGVVRPRFRGDGTYLVTGGLGGLGLLFARWLVERGARRLVLTGRSPLPPRDAWDALEPGSTAAERVAAVRELEGLGAAVRAAALDAADAGALDALLAGLRRDGWGPVRGVLHAAGVSQPRLVLQTDAATLTATLRPKLVGGWLLHDRLAGEPLDFFVLFSSVASLGFSMGMTDYAAGNAFLDGLAAHRRSLGLAAAAIDWGPWGEVGMASLEGVGESFVQRGFVLIPPEQGLEAMERVLEHEPVQPVLLGADWPRAAERNYPVAAPPLLDRLVARSGEAQAAAAEAPASLRERLSGAVEAEREEILAGHLRQMAAAVLRFDAASLDPARSLSSFGLDSMLAVELRNRAESTLGAGPSVVELLQGASIDDLATLLLPRLDLAPAGGDPQEPAAAPAAAGDAGGDLPLTHGQRALWFLHQREPESSAYNVAFAGRLAGPVDAAALERACQWLVDRHPALRTRYTLADGRPVQRVEPRRPVAFAVVDAAGLDDETLRRRVEREYHSPFDLADGPLLRVHLFRRGPEDHVLLLAAHHLAVDGWSLFLLLEELRAFYPAARDGAEPALAPPAAEYAEHVRRQQELLAGAEGERQWEYWSRQLEPLPPPLELPTDRPRPRMQTANGAAHTFVVGREVAAGLRRFAQEEETTLFVVLVAVLEALLHRVAGQERFAVGGTTAGRPGARFAGVVGHFVNSLVLRADLSAGPSFRELVRQARRTVLEAFEHQDYPFPLLVERLQPQWDPSRAPLFQASLVLQNLPGLDRLAELLSDAPGSPAAVDFGGFTVSPFPLDQQAGQHELELEVFERPESLLVVLQYNTDLFDAATAERLARRFVALAADAVARPDAPVAELELVDEEARARRQAGDRQRLRVSRRQGVQLGAAKEGTRAAEGAAPQPRRLDG